MSNTSSSAYAIELAFEAIGVVETGMAGAAAVFVFFVGLVGASFGLGGVGARGAIVGVEVEAERKFGGKLETCVA